MRRRLLAILLLGPALAGCAGSPSASERTAELVHRDWTFIADQSHFTGHPELDESTVDDVQCPAVPDDGGTIVCTARIDLRDGPRRAVPVTVRLDDAATVTAWTIGG